LYISSFRLLQKLLVRSLKADAVKRRRLVVVCVGVARIRGDRLAKTLARGLIIAVLKEANAIGVRRRGRHLAAGRCARQEQNEHDEPTTAWLRDCSLGANLLAAHGAKSIQLKRVEKMWVGPYRSRIVATRPSQAAGIPLLAGASESRGTVSSLFCEAWPAWLGQIKFADL
jgi:hypothetical protein